MLTVVSPLWMLILLATPAESPTVFGVELGAARQAVQKAFKPVGKTKAGTWVLNDDRTIMIWRCEAQKRCFATPSRAEFHFVNSRLASAAFQIDAERGPPDTSAGIVLFEAEARARLGAPVATTQSVGRRTRYFTRAGHTVVWTQDGRDAQIRMSVDKHDPIGRAEAVANGAPAGDLKKIHGAMDYAKAHKAIVAKDWATALKHLRTVRRARYTPQSLKTQSTLVMAMALAARAKSRSTEKGDWKVAARADLERAQRLAPEMKADLATLSKSLGL